MVKLQSQTGIILTLDPNNEFPMLNQGNMYDILGIIPSFISDPFAPIWDQIESSYGFPLMKSTEGTVNDRFEYDYPEDPTLQPLAIYETETEIMAQYQYGICTIFSKNDPKNAIMTRMD